MINKKIPPCLRRASPGIWPFLIPALATAMLYTCNLSYENMPPGLNKNTHSLKPPFSTIIHGANFRFPHGSCSQVQCHGANLTGGNTGGISCLVCHDNQWSVFSDTHTLNIGGSYHHKDVETTSSFLSACGSSTCHGNGATLYANNNMGYNYRYSCYACHNPIPVPGHTELPFLSSVKHAKKYRFPKTTGNCNRSTCHGATLTGEILGGPSCYRADCHDDQWSVFSDGTHINIRGGYYHRNGDNSDCTSCHGSTLHGVPGYNYRYSCYVCHDPIPD